MKGSVSARWINALVITTVAFMWLSVAGGVVIGIRAASASASNCSYDSELQGYYDEHFRACTPK